MADSEKEMSQVSGLASGGNRLLAAICASDLTFLEDRGSRRNFDRGEVLCSANEPANVAHFIERGIASVVKQEGERKAEVCFIGREGFTGSAIVQADGRSPYETFVQADYLSAFCVSADVIRQLVGRSPEFTAILLKAAHVQMIQISENLVSAVWQRASVRLARWLLMYHDRADTFRLEVTHDFMAMMIGSQRTKVTEALHDLEAAGAITSTRGRVVITDKSILERMADGTYGCAEREAKRLFAMERRG